MPHTQVQVWAENSGRIKLLLFGSLSSLSFLSLFIIFIVIVFKQKVTAKIAIYVKLLFTTQKHPLPTLKRKFMANKKRTRRPNNTEEFLWFGMALRWNYGTTLGFGQYNVDSQNSFHFWWKETCYCSIESSFSVIRQKWESENTEDLLFVCNAFESFLIEQWKRLNNNYDNSTSSEPKPWQLTIHNK